MYEPFNPTSNIPYVIIPRAVFDGLYQCSLTLVQFHIITFCYFQADRTSYRVQGYSADAVCRWLGLDAENKVLARYRRAASDLRERHIIKSDYRQCTVDPSSPDRGGRSYSVWVPRPERFLCIGTAEENDLSLWKSDVRLPETNKVRLADAPNADLPSASATNQTDNVRQMEAKKRDVLFVLTSKAPQSREKEPLNPPSGDFSPAPLPLKGEDAQPAGVSNLHREAKAAGKGRALTPEQCDALTDAVTFYIAVVVRLFHGGFSPNEAFTRNLLRVYMPTELLFAHTRRVSVPERVPTKALNNFYASAARLAINAARQENKSTAVPDFDGDHVKRWNGVADTWARVLAAWNKISSDRQDLGFPDPGLAAQAKRAARELQNQANARAREIQRQQADAKRLEVEGIANQERLAKQAATEEQRKADKAKYLEDFEAKRLAQQHAVQLEKEYRAVWDDLSVDAYDWCAAHQYKDEMLTIWDRLFMELHNHRQDMRERKRLAALPKLPPEEIPAEFGGTMRRKS